MPSNDLRNSSVSRTLDRIDRQLIRALAKDARASNKELAAEVGVAASTCHQRLRRLIESGVIRGFHADIDPQALGVGVQALLSLRLTLHSRDQHAKLREYLCARPEVSTVYNVSGRDDFLVHVVARDTHHLRDLVVDGIAVRDEVSHVETMLIFETLRTGNLPDPGD